jgi:hypothetical protein
MLLADLSPVPQWCYIASCLFIQIQASSLSLYAMLDKPRLFYRLRPDSALTNPRFLSYPTPSSSPGRLLSASQLLLVSQPPMHPLPLAVYPPHFRLLINLQPLMHSHLNPDPSLHVLAISPYPFLPSTMHSHVRIFPWSSTLSIPGSSLPHSRQCAPYPCPFVLVTSVSHSRHPLLLSVCQCILVFALRLNFEFL